jgi:hypothetical protein
VFVITSGWSSLRTSLTPNTLTAFAYPLNAQPTVVCTRTMLGSWFFCHCLGAKKVAKSRSFSPVRAHYLFSFVPAREFTGEVRNNTHKGTSILRACGRHRIYCFLIQYVSASSILALRAALICIDQAVCMYICFSFSPGAIMWKFNSNYTLEIHSATRRRSRPGRL